MKITVRKEKKKKIRPRQLLSHWHKLHWLCLLPRDRSAGGFVQALQGGVPGPGVRGNGSSFQQVLGKLILPSGTTRLPRVPFMYLTLYASLPEFPQEPSGRKVKAVLWFNPSWQWSTKQSQDRQLEGKLDAVLQLAQQLLLSHLQVQMLLPFFPCGFSRPCISPLIQASIARGRLEGGPGDFKEHEGKIHAAQPWVFLLFQFHLR